MTLGESFAFAIGYFGGVLPRCPTSFCKSSSSEAARVQVFPPCWSCDRDRLRGISYGVSAGLDFGDSGIG